MYKWIVDNVHMWTSPWRILSNGVRKLYKDCIKKLWNVVFRFDSYTCSYDLGNETYNIRLSDTYGQEDYDRLRVTSYLSVSFISINNRYKIILITLFDCFWFQTDCYLLCYSVANRKSFESVFTKYSQEMKVYPTVPIVLVGEK